MKTSIRTGAYIGGDHWVAEYVEHDRQIRVYREGSPIGTYDAPPSLFGNERDAGSQSVSDHRALEAALLASLKRFAAEYKDEA